MKILVLCGLICNLGLLVSSKEEGDLQTVVVLFRHGDRAPIDMYPNDPYRDRKNWPVGFGQLTSRGKMMQYHLGQYLRKRYDHFLSPTYDENDIYVRSSDVDRTLMSAMSNLAGLYPPVKEQEWNPKLLWQPIPVHTLPLEEDNVISSHANCPRLKRLMEELSSDPTIKDIISKNDWVFKYLTNHTGAPVKSLLDIDYLYDTLYIENLYNLTLPEWTHRVFPDQMKPMTDLSFKLSTWSLQMKRLRGGPLVTSIIDHFQGFIDKKHERKMLMYSGHDTTLSSLLNTLGMFDPPIAPPYASLIMIELFKKNGTFLVSFSYRNNTHEDPYKLKLFDCQMECPLEDFKILTKKFRPEDNWKSECGLLNDPTMETVTIFSIGTATILFLILTLSVIYACVRHQCCRKEENYKYLSISTRS